MECSGHEECSTGGCRILNSIFCAPAACCGLHRGVELLISRTAPPDCHIIMDRTSSSSVAETSPVHSLDNCPGWGG